MATETETTVISIQIDETAKAKLVKGLADVQATIRKVAAESVNMGEAASVTASKIADLTKEEKALKTSISAIESGIDKQAQSFENATRAADSYEEQLRAIKAGGADLSGDIAGSLGGLRGATSAIGLGGIAEAPLGIAEAAADLGEFLPKLKVGLEGAGAALQANTGILGTVATQGGAAVASLTGVSASMGGLIAVAAPLALGIGAVVAVGAALVTLFNQYAEAQERIAKATVEAETSAASFVQAGATTADIVLDVQRLTDEADNLRAQIDALEAARQASFNTPEYDFATDRERFAAIQDLERQFQSTVIAASELQATLGTAEVAANDVTASEAQLAEMREETAQEAIKSQEEAARNAEISAQKIAALQTQLADLQINRSIQEANAAAINALERKFTQQDEKAETAAHWQDLANITKQGQARVASIQAELSKLPAQQAQELADIQGKGNEKLSANQADYFKSQIEATQDFAKSQKRIATETAKTAKRLADDIADNLADAARANDVVAFLKIQRDGQKDLTRNAEDANASERQRTEDFIAAQEKERASFQAKQNDIYKGIADEKARVLQSYAEKRLALETQIQQERANTQAAIQNANARYQSSEAQEQQAASRDAQRRALRQSQEEAAFQRQISAIQSRINAESTLYNSISAGIARVTAQANSMASANKSASNSSKGSYFGTVGNNITGSGRFGGGYDRSSSSGATINLNNPQFGEIATPSQITNVLRVFAQQQGQAWINGIQRAQK